MKHLVCSIFLIHFIALNSSAQPAWLTSELKSKTEAFNFWIGEWDVYRYGTDTIVGDSKIESIIDGFGIRETYHAIPPNFHGTSLNKYNFSTQQWEQYWVDNSGVSLHIKGGLSDGKMVMENRSPSQNGLVNNKITWGPLPDGTVRQSWDISNDDGKTWQRIFDGLYKKKAN